MTAAYRLKGLGWFVACVGVVLAFYLVSLQVAAERKALEQVNGRIRTAERDIRALETEFDTRANLAQLERWNGDTLALTAPVAGQFLADEAQLAAISFNGAAPDAAVRTAALVVPSLPLPPVVAAAPVVPAATAAPVRQAPPPAVTAGAVQVAQAVPAPAPASLRISAAKARTMAKPVATRVSPAALATVRTAANRVVADRVAAPRAKPQMAMLDRKLLSDTTFGDLMSGARVEAAKRR